MNGRNCSDEAESKQHRPVQVTNTSLRQRSRGMFSRGEQFGIISTQIGERTQRWKEGDDKTQEKAW